MCREDAAKVCVDVLLGNRGDYASFLEAIEALSVGDRMAIERAVSDRRFINGKLPRSGGVFFWSSC
jgi:hypothetical protein